MTRQRRADHNGERAAICDAELSVGPVEVDLHSGLRDGGFPRDLFVGQPLGHKPGNLRFATRQQLLKSQGARLGAQSRDPLASVRPSHAGPGPPCPFELTQKKTAPRGGWRSGGPAGGKERAAMYLNAPSDSTVPNA